MVPEALITTASSSAAVNAAYYVVRLLRHRFYTIPGGERELLVEGLTNNPPAAVMTIAKQAIHDIETSEKVSIYDLTPDRAGRYVSELEDFVRKRFTEGFEIDKGRGEQLLNELRHTANE